MTVHPHDNSTTHPVSRRDVLNVGLGAGGALFVVFGLP